MSPQQPVVPAADRTWILEYDGFEPAQERLREALCALGNGRFVTRGAAEEMQAGAVHYPGTYIAGGYNCLVSEVAGHRVSNEDLVNFPNWLPLNFRPEGGDWLDLGSVEILELHRKLYLREGVLHRRLRVRDRDGRVTTVESRRLVSMRCGHLAAIDYRITAENWDGDLRIHSGIDGSVTNAGVERYRQLASQHLVVRAAGPVAPEGIFLLAETTHSHMQVAEAARTSLYRGDERIETKRQILEDLPDRIGEELFVGIDRGETLRVEKVVALRTSRDRGATEVGADARRAIMAAPGFEPLLRTQRLTWQALWRRYDVQIDDEAAPGALDREQLILRLHIFHVLQTISLHSAALDVGAPARGLHGEAYRGHVFWDELFIFPFYNLRVPSITRALLMYRYHRLEAARSLAREAGHAGALYPWQSSSAGLEATQQLHLNPLTNRWGPDWSHLQRHVNAAIAYNIWRYWQASGDREFLVEHGAEMILEIARFWSSIAKWNEERERYDIEGVMGPDEYHEKYPDAETGGLRNNAYTNVMAVWCILRALDVLDAVGIARRGELLSLLGIREDDLQRWQQITQRMTIPFHGDGIISQFEGYDSLEEIDWAAYRAKYGNVERFDRILRSENDSPDRYKVSKQADVSMLFYLLDQKELEGIFQRLGYRLDPGMIWRNVEYYLQRTSHGSTLSKMVLASVMCEVDCETAFELFGDALRSDIDDIQGGTTGEGIHLGAMAGTLAILLRRYAGVGLGADGVTFDPELPRRLGRLQFRIFWRGKWLDVVLTHRRLTLSADGEATEAVPVRVRGRWHQLEPKQRLELDLTRARQQ